MAISQKPAVIEWIYRSLIDPDSGELTRSIVTQDDIITGIEATGVSLSKRNPANFMKDVIRGTGASRMWPEALKEARVTAVQVTGDGNVFQFIPYSEGQTDPFPSKFGYHDGVERHRIQSVSVPLATKSLGRDDETYLIQVAVKLAVVETHFALVSPIKTLELNHLQIGIKLRKTEIDSMYSATYIKDDGSHGHMIITAEAKKHGQRILVEQVIQQVKAAFDVTNTDFVVPIAMTAAEGGIYIAEFHGVHRHDLDFFETLQLNAEMLYELTPKVNGI